MKKMMKDELDLLRLDAIEARERYLAMGLMNTAVEYMERMKGAVAYHKAREDWLLAQARYEAAVEAMIRQEMEP